MRQIADGGAPGLSLNAIARQLGLTGPAIYRYVASRDELLTMLLGDAFDELAAALEAAVARRRRPERALRAAAHAYRTWALANPIRYQLMVGRASPGYESPDHLVARAQASLMVLVRIVEQLLAVGAAEEALVAATRGWARLHGLVSLELAGHLEVLGVDAARMLDDELDRFLVDVAHHREA